MLPASPTHSLAVSSDRSEYGRRIYDWWSTHQGVYGTLVRLAFFGRDRAARRRALAALSLEPGDAVLDVGCGAGVNFETLATSVGPEGIVVGFDYSREMVRTARDEASTVPAPTAVVRGDATTLPFLKHSFDAAYATLSISAMSDAESVIENVHRVLRPGGRLAVVDARPFQKGPWRVLNPLVNPISTLATNWHPEANVVEAIRRTFGDSETWTTNAGTLYVAIARKRNEP